MSETSKYLTIEALRHNGVRYPANAHIELTAKEADDLIQLKRIKPNTGLFTSPVQVDAARADAEAAQLRERLEEAKALLVEKDDLLATRDGQIALANSNAAELRQQLDDARASLAQRDAQVTALEATVEKLQAQAAPAQAAPAAPGAEPAAAPAAEATKGKAK